MAPPKSKSQAPAPEEIIEEIVPESQHQSKHQQSVTFVLDEQDNVEYGEDIGEDIDEDIDEDFDEDNEDIEDVEDIDDDDDEEDALTTAVGQLTQLMMTEEGEAITDVLNGIRDSIEKQNKILYRGLQLLEARFARK